MADVQPTTTPEEWRDITPEVIGHPVGDGYQGSSLGRIRSRRRSGPHRHCGLREKWRVLKPVVNRDGYWRFNLVNADGTMRIWQGHRITALLFLGPPPPGKELVCHNDGNPGNNAVDNLRWGDSDDNTADAMRHGTQPSGEKHGMAVLAADQVREIIWLSGNGC